MTWNADTPRTPLETRFLAKVIKTDWCWHWTGARCGPKRDYGCIYSGERTALGNTKLIKAHRCAYELYVGPIPEGLTIDHLCKNTLCVNPKHLEAVTQRVNTLRGSSLAALNARKTHCKRGHPLSGANLIINGKQRKCRTCENAGQMRRYYERTRGAA